MRTDIVRTYKDIHSWVGIISGLALFIAFYAGAITMFEGPLQRWASPPPELSAPPSLERTPELVAKVLAEHPNARKSYRSEEHTSELQSLMRISYAVFCLKKKNNRPFTKTNHNKSADSTYSTTAQIN